MDTPVSPQGWLELAAIIALLTILCKLRSRFIYSNLNAAMARPILAPGIAGLNLQLYKNSWRETAWVCGGLNINNKVSLLVAFRNCGAWTLARFNPSMLTFHPQEKKYRYLPYRVEKANPVWVTAIAAPRFIYRIRAMLVYFQTSPPLV